MFSCPKCSSRDIAGPYFRRDFGRECLVYRCMRCGYSREEPCHDARKDDGGFQPNRPTDWQKWFPNDKWPGGTISRKPRLDVLPHDRVIPQPTVLPYSRSIQRRLDAQSGQSAWTDQDTGLMRVSDRQNWSLST